MQTDDYLSSERESLWYKVSTFSVEQASLEAETRQLKMEMNELRSGWIA